MPALDGLRALAVIAVLLYHADLGWIPGGFLGVEVFFVISGYLITLLLVNEHEQNGRISLRRFWFRRARRLLPAAYALLLVVSLTVVLFVREQAEQTRGDVVAGLTYTTNWYLIFTGQSYFQSFGRPSLLHHLWSLAVEEQFYLVWPLILILLLVVCRRRPERMVIPMLAMVAGSTVLMAVLYNPADPSRAYYGTDTRAGGLILGATFALFWRPGYLGRGAVAAKGRILDLVGLAGLGALAVIMATIRDQDALLYRGGFLLVGLATARLHRHGHPPEVDRGQGAGPAAHRVGRHALVRHLPVALARVLPHPARRRRAVESGAHARLPAGRHRRAGRAVVPARGGPDPPRRHPPVGHQPVPLEGRRSPAPAAHHPLGGGHPVGGHRRQRGRAWPTPSPTPGRSSRASRPARTP